MGRQHIYHLSYYPILSLWIFLIVRLYYVIMLLESQKTPMSLAQRKLIFPNSNCTCYENLFAITSLPTYPAEPLPWL